MTDEVQDEIQQWRQLKQRALNGEMQLDEEVGQALSDECAKYHERLLDIADDARHLGKLSGYGGLPSALAMKQKFEQKAVGGAPHDPDDNAVTRIKQLAEIAELMRDTYLASIGKLQQTDQQTSQQLTKTGKHMR